MWVNPKYAPPSPAAAREPRSEGRRLATLPRPGHGRKDEEELRVSLDEYQGHEYVSIRLWFRSPRDGAWYPTKKGTSIRLRELEPVIDALTEANHATTAERPEPPRSRREAPNLPGIPAGGAGFDEFS